MTFDKPEHKALILEMFKQMQFPGHALEIAFETKRAVQDSTIECTASALMDEHRIKETIGKT